MHQNIMKVSVVCAALALLAGCVTVRDCVKNDKDACERIKKSSPVIIEPRKDKPPKVRVKTGIEGCKWGGNPLKKEVKFVCRWDVDI